MVPCIPDVSDAHAPGCLHHIEENVIHHAGPSFSIAPWASSDAHVSIVNVFDGGQGLKWVSCLVCSNVATQEMNCDALCVLTPFYHN